MFIEERQYKLSITTQGPTYPPSEIMDQNGNFIVIGRLNLQNEEGKFYQEWGSAIVSKDSELPVFGQNIPYKIVKNLDFDDLEDDSNIILHTLPLPLPCNNYNMDFAPEQKPSFKTNRPSYPLHLAPIPDIRENDGRKVTTPIILGNWIKANGVLTVSIFKDKKSANFGFELHDLIPNSLYTVMALRENDLNPKYMTRPGPLGVPNVFITDENGSANYNAVMPNPFESSSTIHRNRIINVIVLWVSTQMSYGGAIGHYGLGGDIHAQLKLKTASFEEFSTIE